MYYLYTLSSVLVPTFAPQLLEVLIHVSFLHVFGELINSNVIIRAKASLIFAVPNY